jgi:sec-independent protein translocase protein TatA
MGLDNPIHILFLLVLALLVFGAKRLPEMGRSLGEGMRGFKDSLNAQPQPAHINAMTTPVSVPVATQNPVVAQAQVAEPAESVHQA